jgi:predicted nucleic acid-binding protein
MPAAIDAGVLIARLRPDHVFHRAALDALRSQTRVVMHTVNFAEVLVGLEHGMWARTRTALEGQGFSFRDTTAAELAAARVDSRLKMPDACVLAVASAAGSVTVLTFDEKLRSAAQAEGFAVNPAPLAT